MELSTTVRNSMLDAIDDDVTTDGYFRLYNQDPDTATGLIKIASCGGNNPFFENAGTGTAGVMSMDNSPAVEDTAPAAGTVTYAGIYDGTAAAANAWLVKLGVDTTGSPDLTMANNTVATTDTVQITSFSITMPAGTPAT